MDFTAVLVAEDQNPWERIAAEVLASPAYDSTAGASRPLSSAILNADRRSLVFRVYGKPRICPALGSLLRL